MEQLLRTGTTLGLIVLAFAVFALALATLADDKEQLQDCQKVCAPYAVDSCATFAAKCAGPDGGRLVPVSEVP